MENLPLIPIGISASKESPARQNAVLSRTWVTTNPVYRMQQLPLSKYGYFNTQGLLVA